MRKFMLVTTGLAVSICVLGMYIGYELRTYFVGEDNKDILQEDSVSESEENTVRIGMNTKIVYEYFNPEDGTSETTEESSPYFLLDMAIDKLENRFTDWEIVEFTEDKVVMRKIVSGYDRSFYIRGIKDGYIAVFYQNTSSGTTLKQMTDTPVTALPREEQKMLEQGIKVDSKTQLAGVLQDYGS